MENSDAITVSETALWGIRAALLDSIENPEPDEGLESAEQALALINQILLK